MSQLPEPVNSSEQMADELFAVVALLDGQPGLRNALSDPTASAEVRKQLATDVFGHQISADTLAALAQAVAQRWGSGAALVDALERQGVRVLLDVSQREGRLDEVEDELFRFSRIVASDDALRVALDDRNAELRSRETLVRDLLDGKADPVTATLAVRAVAARHRTYVATLEDILALAAQAQQRAVAHVTVAAPLTDDQKGRLQQTLATQAGRPVTMAVTVDPSVLGGVRVRIGDELIDGTVGARLEAAKRQLN